MSPCTVSLRTPVRAWFALLCVQAEASNPVMPLLQCRIQANLFLLGFEWTRASRCTVRRPTGRYGDMRIVHLNLGEYFNCPLLPCVLPDSLRELIVSTHYRQPLPLGSLPALPKIVVFAAAASFQQPLQPGVVPVSVEVLGMGRDYTAGSAVREAERRLEWAD